MARIGLNRQATTSDSTSLAEVTSLAGPYQPSLGRGTRTTLRSRPAGRAGSTRSAAYAAMKACGPAKPAAPVVSGTSGSTTSLDVSWTAPAIDNYDLRYWQGTSGNWTDGPQERTGTSATIGSLDSDTEYQVRVRASNDEGDGDWSGRNRGEVSEKCPRTRSLPARATAM